MSGEDRIPQLNEGTWGHVLIIDLRGVRELTAHAKGWNAGKLVTLRR